MFLPSSSDFRFCAPSTAEGATWVAGNREKTLFAVLSPEAVFIYHANPQVLLCTFRRDVTEVEERGAFTKCIWRHDSAALCVLTRGLSVYIFALEISEDTEPFNVTDRSTDADKDIHKLTQAFLLRQRIPTVSIYVAVLAKISSVATCAASLKDDLFLCLSDGWIHRITWNGEVRQDLSFSIRNVSISNDQINAKYSRIGGNSVYVTDIVYCPLVGGLAVVLSDGRAALLASQDYRFDIATIFGIWTSGLNNAVCVAANHKFRLLYFGCENGDVAAYHLDDSNGAMVQTFRIKLSIKDGTEFLNRLGRVTQIRCLPQGFVFAVTWGHFTAPIVASASVSSTSTGSTQTVFGDSSLPEAEIKCPPPVLALFSPFGAQWWTSLENACDRLNNSSLTYSCVEWGAEGFQLWTAFSGGFALIHLSRALSVNQPSLECLDMIALLSAESVMLSPPRPKEKLATAPHCFWNTYAPPQEYISVNWPLKFAALDCECSKTLVVAGNRGFAHLNLKTLKWRLFRNETQEQNFLVTGGVAVFQEHIIAVGSDLTKNEEAIYIYSMNSQFDQATAFRHKISNRAMLINLRNDHMLTFDVASVLTIYVLRQIQEPNSTELGCTIEQCAEIRIHELLPHPTCVISMQLTSLNYHSEAAAFCHSMDSLLVNVSGHLLLLSPFHKEGNDSSSEDLFQLHQPVLIASNVERVWIHSGNREVPHLNKALWINAGSKSMKVWLPLFHTDAYESGTSKSSRSFISRRIMLPVELNLYPIAIDQDCLAGGVESLPLATSSPLFVHNVTRNSEVFIHRLLRQLLKRNLGVYALEIATSCRTLLYFSHILELLLHDVLDEEATSSEPIPDPLLPRVVAFIHEFPEYLETIVHCARKTELAFWNLLFSVSHHPRELFKMCLKEDQLDTATSCLIILQTMESTVASVQHATVLLEEALNKRRWLIAKDIVRFLRSIEGSDLDETPDALLYQKRVLSKPKQIQIPSTPPDDYNLVFNSISVETQRPAPKLSLSAQSSSHSPNGPSTTLSGTQPMGIIPESPTSPGFESSFLSSFNAFSLNSGTTINATITPRGRISIPAHLAAILDKHAELLVDDFALRDVGAFASHLDYDLSRFLLKKAGAFGCSPEEFPLVLMKLHSQFKWPYPVVGDVVDKLIERITSVTPSASEDETATSPSSITRRRSSPRSTFDWKIFEKLCAKSSAKATQQPTEPEVKYLMSQWLAKSDSLEWIYMLSLMHRDLSTLHGLIEGNLVDKRRLSSFLRRVTEGSKILLAWARENCRSYVSIIKLFTNFLEHVNDQQRIRRFTAGAGKSSLTSSNEINLANATFYTNGTNPRQ